MAAAFPTTDLPPLETSYWLVKPRSLVRGTLPDPTAAAGWLRRQLASYAPRFGHEARRDAGRLARIVSSAAERLGSGGDASYGFYLERPSYLSLAVVTCSPNRAKPNLPCPLDS